MTYQNFYLLLQLYFMLSLFLTGWICGDEGFDNSDIRNWRKMLFVVVCLLFSPLLFFAQKVIDLPFWKWLDDYFCIRFWWDTTFADAEKWKNLDLDKLKHGNDLLMKKIKKKRWGLRLFIEKRMVAKINRINNYTYAEASDS